jgi:hypothetical protein
MHYTNLGMKTSGLYDSSYQSVDAVEFRFLP